MAGLLYLPGQNWGLAPRQDLAAAAQAVGSAASRQMVLAAEGRRVPVTLGRDRIGPLLANYLSDGAYNYSVCVWGQGPIDAIESVTLGDSALPGGVIARHYLGGPGQLVDGPLAAAFAGQGIAYADAYPGVAYSVFQVQTGIEFDPLTLAGIVRGLKAYDPRTGLTGWTDNPSLLLAHVLSSLLGRTVVWSSVSVCADANDELVGGERRRRLGMTISDPISADALLASLRTYAACWIVPRSDGLHLIPDRPASAVRSIGPGQIFTLGPIDRRRRADLPTVLSVGYTDTSALPWRDVSVTVKLPGVDAGSIPWRVSEVPLPGIQSASQATREAIERLNKLHLQDISFPFTADDTVGDLEPGDVVNVSHAIGLADKPARITDIEATSPGRYTIRVAEFDPAVYSDAVITAPTTPDTRLPSPTAPAPVTGLALEERRMQLRDGTWTSGIVASWLSPALPWIADFRIDVRVGADIVLTGTAPRSATSWPSPPVQELVQHQVDVYVRTLLGAESAVASATITPQGKLLPPGNVPSLDGYEVGGEVRLRWGIADDNDISRYEIRWGAVGVAWDDATLLNRVDALSVISKDIPAGTWDFLVAALDSVDKYSPAPARRTIAVSLDAASILVDQHDFTSPVVTGMAEYSLGPGDAVRRWATEDGVPFVDKFTAPLSTYTSPLASYSSGAAWQTEPYDFGLSLAGNWAGELSVTVLSGSVVEYLDLSADGVSWASTPGLAAKTSARFARLRAVTAGSMIVTLPRASIRLDAVARTEEGVITTSVSGPSTVTLDGAYAAAKGLPQVTVSGVVPAYAVVDNIQMGPPAQFDIYVFDSTGSQVARQAGWVFKGV